MNRTHPSARWLVALMLVGIGWLPVLATSLVRLKADATYDSVRLKADATYTGDSYADP